jgi:hypothetical protein
MTNRSWLTIQNKNRHEKNQTNFLLLYLLQMQYHGTIWKHNINDAGAILHTHPYRCAIKEFIMKFIFNRLAAVVMLTATAGLFMASTSIAAPAVSMSTNDVALASAVQEVLVKSMGDVVKDLTVTVQNGAVTLHGFVSQPREEEQARYVTSKVPGVTAAYSNIHTWSSDDRY